ncbi:30S ribosomal protein S13 [Candidatus Woesearchaeota archaeon]|nr:30S ribosomal protein S13 [Candidatus Woesearchaeota archaeon]
MKADFKHIVRIANVDLQGEKTLVVALTKIKGVGMNLAHAICAAAKVDKHLRTGNMNEEQIKSLNQITSSFATLPKWLFNRRKDFETGADMHLLTGNLTFYVDNDLKRMKKIKSYKGLRHQKGLTVRGQRTKSNFRRNKGKVVGVVKKKIAPEAGDKGDKKGGDKKGKK